MYSHTQHWILFWLLPAVALFQAILPGLIRMPPVAEYILWGDAAFIMLLSFAFIWLRIEDQEDHLRVAFGPLTLFSKRIAYQDIREFAAERTGWLDGWGVRYVRGGWLFNLQGFDCVRITTDRQIFRVGTDDVPGLLQLLEDRTGQPPA